jgi:hypothetical protein
MHVDGEHAVAAAFLTAAAGDIEAEAAGVIAAHAGGGQLGEQFADGRESAGVGGGVRAGTAADGLLIDDDYLVDAAESADAVVFTRLVLGGVEVPHERAAQDGVHEGGLAAAGGAGDADETAQREGDGEVAEVVLAGAVDGEDIGRWKVEGGRRREFL